VGLEFPRLGEAGDIALKLSHQGRLVCIIPPVRQLDPAALALPPGARVAALFIPETMVPALGACLEKLRPEIMVIYGSPQKAVAASGLPGWVRGYLTREGAVSLHLSGKGVGVRQWRP